MKVRMWPRSARPQHPTPAGHSIDISCTDSEEESSAKAQITWGQELGLSSQPREGHWNI